MVGPPDRSIPPSPIGLSRRYLPSRTSPGTDTAHDGISNRAPRGRPVTRASAQIPLVPTSPTAVAGAGGARFCPAAARPGILVKLRRFLMLRVLVWLIGLLTRGAALHYLVDVATIAADNMLPTVLPGDHVLVWRHATPRWGRSFCASAGEPSQLTLGRVVGLPGQTVGAERGRLPSTARQPTSRLWARSAFAKPAGRSRTCSGCASGRASEHDARTRRLVRAPAYRGSGGSSFCRTTGFERAKTADTVGIGGCLNAFLRFRTTDPEPRVLKIAASAYWPGGDLRADTGAQIRPRDDPR